MVYLSRIYTRTGDQGETSLGDGTRVPKDDPRVAAMGGVDELNALIGVLLAQHPGVAEAELLSEIQNDLFDLGADLCMPRSETERPDEHLRIRTGHVTRLEQAIDRLNAGLAPLTSFILPGGTAAAAWCQLARAVCRRAERDTVALTRGGGVGPHASIYLNRLSDFLFVLARVVSDGREDLWVPGKNRGD